MNVKIDWKWKLDVMHTYFGNKTFFKFKYGTYIISFKSGNRIELVVIS